MERNISEKVFNAYQSRFSGKPIAVRSPGRINLIGEHTDYNDGWVLPAAIDRELILMLGANGTTTCNLFSCDMNEQYSFSIDRLEKSSYGWANYVIGMVHHLQQEGKDLAGFDCAFGGNIPIGAGLSSSAALECGVGYGLNMLWDYQLSKLEIARIAQQAEIQFAGVNCGIMDQYANMFGLKDHLIKLDCRNLTHQCFSVDLRGHCLLLFNSGVKHQLADTAYNERRRECESGVRILSEYYPEIKSLRDCSMDMLSKLNHKDHQVIRTRCEYVLEENERVIEGSLDLEQGRLAEFGEKMYRGHEGLRKKYQVSCEEIDLLVDMTLDDPGVLGARMMGGGFGGCTLNLIKDSSANEVADRISSQYQKLIGKELKVYQVSLANGTSCYQGLAQQA